MNYKIKIRIIFVELNYSKKDHNISIRIVDMYILILKIIYKI